MQESPNPPNTAKLYDFAEAKRARDQGLKNLGKLEAPKPIERPEMTGEAEEEQVKLLVKELWQTKRIRVKLAPSTEYSPDRKVRKTRYDFLIKIFDELNRLDPELEVEITSLSSPMNIIQREERNLELFLADIEIPYGLFFRKFRSTVSLGSEDRFSEAINDYFKPKRKMDN